MGLEGVSLEFPESGETVYYGSLWYGAVAEYQALHIWFADAVSADGTYTDPNIPCALHEVFCALGVFDEGRDVEPGERRDRMEPTR